jgi:VWFA-related protein
VTGRPAILVASLGLATLAASAAPRQAIYQKATQTVAVYATVLDKDGHLVANLARKDFQILDNGKPAEITVFSNDEQSLTVALMLDVSYSMQNRINLVKDSTRRFIDALQPGDRLRLGTFAEEVAVSPLLTGDKADLLRVLDEEVWPGGTTPLWTAIDEAMTSLKSETSRRVVMTLTDGVSTSGRVPFDQVKTHAVDDGFMIYVVGMEGTTLGSTMTSLADETGGGHFEVKKGATLTTTFARVADELRHQYALGFTAVALDGQVHAIEVRVAKAGLVARARKSYLATADK